MGKLQVKDMLCPNVSTITLLSMMILKEAAAELTPLVQFLFMQSLHTGLYLRPSSKRLLYSYTRKAAEVTWIIIN